MTLSRDSALWWGGMIAAVITGLALNLDAFPWMSETARHWITLGATIVGIVSGKLATSPLPSEREVAVQRAADAQQKIDLGKVGKPMIVIFLLMTSTSCATAGGPKHIASVSVVSAHAVLSAVQDTERALVCGVPTAPAPPACVPDATHRKISTDLVAAFDYDSQVARVVRSLPAGAALPANVAELIGKIRALVDGIIATLPGSPQKQSLVAQLGGAL